ncbi:MAG: 2,5-diamino-6-(ribosylamino)-4(3H)-pyrimidinone 5'-phosphate reductase [Anaerolineales bacterium]|jgi:2,5-diamino-6-(ribosylamino)-4(3H)-pyrimidinone 5'-phosphate reductase
MKTQGTNRPHVIVNVAMSLDGKIDTAARQGAMISSPTDKARVDRLRAEADAILVGGRTLIHEDPKLTVKSAQLRAERKLNKQEENPVKVGVVSVADLKLDGDFLTAGPARRWIYTTQRTSVEQIHSLEKAGAQVRVVGKEVVDLRLVMKSLQEEGIRKLMVEGGGTLIAEFFRLGLVDEVYTYLAPLIFGGANAPTLADGPGFSYARASHLELESAKPIDGQGGILLHYFVQKS